MNIIDKASLMMVPSAYKAGKLYSIIPADGSGDFTVARNSESSRVRSDKYIEFKAANVPTLDYSDSTCPALSTNPQSTNKILYPFDYGNTWWTKSGATIDNNGGANYPSPIKDSSGNIINCARKLVEDTSDGGHRLYRSVTSEDGTFSQLAIAKAAERHKFQLSFGSSAYSTMFDLSTGTFVETGITGSEMIELADNWWMCTIGRTQSSQDSYTAIVLADENGNTNYQGDGTSGILIAGSQFEEQPATTPLINNPLNADGAEVTRLADSITSSTFADKQSYSFFIDLQEIKRVGDPSITSNQKFVYVYDSTGTVFMLAISSASRIALYSIRDSQYIGGSYGIDANKIVVSFDSSTKTVQFIADGSVFAETILPSEHPFDHFNIAGVFSIAKTRAVEVLDLLTTEEAIELTK